VELAVSAELKNEKNDLWNYGAGGLSCGQSCRQKPPFSNLITAQAHFISFR